MSIRDCITSAVADVFDALSSKRPYKSAFPWEKCCEILEEGRGQHFDANVVDGIANGIAGSLRLSAGGLRLLQTGQVQVYGAIGFAGLLIAGGLVFLLNPL